jgi:hypothetical protein
MKNHRRSVRVPVCLAALMSLFLLLAARQSHGATVAYWQFEPGNLAADSSGNNNTLAVTGITSSSDVAPNAPGTGSAYFDGTSSASVPLDLTADTNLTVEWFMKVTNRSGLQIFMELSPNFNFNNGTFVAYINELDTTLTVANDAFGVYNRDTPYLAGAWHHYAMTIDSSVSGSKERVQIYVDGVRMDNANARFVGGASTNFGNYTLYIGARGGGGYFLANNWLDEIRVSDRILTPNQFLAPTNYPNSSIGVLQSPADATVPVFTTANFQAMANVTNAPLNMLSYAWQSSSDGGVTWTNIPGAKGLSSSDSSLTTSYSISSVTAADDGAKFRVALAEIAGQAVTNYTTAATLHVNMDVTPPTFVKAASVEGVNFGLTFSEVLDTNSSLAASNYTIVGTTITNVVPIQGGKSVLLQGDTLLSGNSFTGQVASVKDLAGNPMPATPVSGPIEGLTLTDIGGAVAIFSSVTNQYVFSDQPGTLRLYNGYGQTAGTADGCWYVWTKRTNDFDIAVQVTNVDTVGAYSRGGLMMNESLDPGSRNVTMGAYSPYMAFMQPYARFAVDTGATAPTPGGFVGYYPNYGQTNSPLFAFPNVWIRMQRTGNILTEYWGTNGVTWNTQGTIDLSSQMSGSPFPSAVYIGLFSDPEDTAAQVGAHIDYKNFGDTILAPSLSIQQTGGTVVLSWAAASTGFSLQSNSSLSSGSWQPVATRPMVQNGTNTVSVPVTDTTYYRLVRSL